MADEEPRAGELTTANYGWTKPTVGASDDAWGGYINTDLDGIDTTVKSVSTVANAAYPASNPSGYQTAAQVTAALPIASSTTPAMDGLAAVGTGTTWARADHVHPVDTSRYAASNPSGYQTAAQVTAAVPVASITTPIMDGLAAVGTGTTWARADHVHPSDTTKLSLAGVVDGSNAPAGQIGEVLSIATASNNVTLTTGVGGNAATLTLTAGDWDVNCECTIVTGSAFLTYNVQLSPTSGTLVATGLSAPRASLALPSATPFLAGASIMIPLRTARISISASTPFYLIAFAGFTGGTTTAGGIIFARRAR